MSENEESVRLYRCPEYRDPQALIELGIASMVRLSRSEDHVVARKASQWLVKYGESLRSSEREEKAEEARGDSPGGSPPLRVC